MVIEEVADAVISGKLIFKFGKILLTSWLGFLLTLYHKD